MDPSDFYSHSLSTPPWLQFEFSTFFGVDLSFSNCPVTSFHFLKELPVFPYFGLSKGLISRIMTSEKFRSQQDSNFRRKTQSDFASDALTTRPWLHDGRSFICVGYCMFNCCVSFYFLKVLRKNHFFESFRSVDKFNVDRKHPNSGRFKLELDGPIWGRFKLELDGPIWFLFSCPQHSATTAFQNL